MESGKLVREKKLRKIGLRGKVVVLFLQIALPFVLYFAIIWDRLPLGIGVGILLVVSMLFLVVFG